MRRRGRDGLLWLSLVCFALTAGGVPLPDAPRLGNSGPYPCQGHHCGCSAGQCWQSCCCYSMSEKLAWAKAHGVTPPDHVLAAVKVAPPPKAKAKPRSCCASKVACAELEHEHEHDTNNYVLGLEHAKCRGAATHWLTLGAVLPWSPPATFVADITAGEFLPLADDSSLSRTARPLTPPPRSV